MRVSASEFQKLDLWAHSFLRDVPLHDAFAIDLPGGGEGRTISDIHALLSAQDALKANPLIGTLFRLRFFLGRVLGWEKNPQRWERHSYLHRLGADDRAQSLVPPGTPDGPFRMLNVLPREAVREIHNATAHAFLGEALCES